MSTARYIIGVLLVVSLPPAMAWWFIVHPFVGFWRRVGVGSTLWITGIAMAAGMVGLFLIRRTLLGADLGTHWPLFGVGVALMVIAGVMGLKRKRYLTFRILAGVPELQSDGRGGHLLVDGPYAVIRHPRYVEVLVGVLAYSLMANYLGGYVLALVTIPVLHAIVLLEERELAERFGEAYEAYRARVPRYVPKFTSATSDTGS